MIQVSDGITYAAVFALAPVTGGPMEHDSPESPEGRLIGARVSENPTTCGTASARPRWRRSLPARSASPSA
jgi:hypothetical protein